MEQVILIANGITSLFKASG